MSAIDPRPSPDAAPVPLVDLGWQHRAVRSRVAAGFESVMARGAYVNGAEVAEFEECFAAYCGVRHCAGVASGTDALELMLRALDLGPGDEVILPANSFVATAEAVARSGAVPVLVDVDPVHHLIDVEMVRARVGARTRAILPVHLYGQMAPMEDLAELAEQHGLHLLEDAAQAQGARRHGHLAGSLGIAAATSFYPGKNLGAYGDGGAVLTDDGAVARRVRALRNHGSTEQYLHAEVGWTSRLDTLQAVVLLAKLGHLDAWNRLRAVAAMRYRQLLDGVPEVVTPEVLPGNDHVWHLYAIRVRARDRVLDHLRRAGIGAAVHYPVPIHLQIAFRHLGYREGDLPVAERAAAELLSLPIHPGITASQQERVVDCLVDALEGAGW